MLLPLLFWSFAALVFGAMVGSFLNVLIYRLPRDSLSIVRPKRSFCPVCGYAIPWYDNLPVYSYLRLAGQCRSCGSRISFRYPLVEALTALLFFSLTLREATGFLEIGPDRFTHLGVLFVHFYAASLMVVITFIDLEFQIIPDELTLSGAVLAPLLCALLPVLQQDSFLFAASLNPHAAAFLSSLSGALLGGGTLLLVGILGKAVLKRDALGLGDVKLMFFVGGLLGCEGALIVFFAGCAVGSLVGVPLRLLTGKREIPFGPFLAFGVLLVLFFKPEIWHFAGVTWPGIVGSLF